MKEISPEELFELYKDTLYKCQSKIFNYPDDIIEMMVLEDFVIGATSFLHDDSLNTLLNNTFKSMGNAFTSFSVSAAWSTAVRYRTTHPKYKGLPSGSKVY